MVIRISELKLRVGHSKEELESEICHILRLPHAVSSAIPEYEIMRRSIDARKKPDLFYVYTIDVRLPHPQSIVKKLKNRHVTAVEPTTYRFSELLPAAQRSQMGRGDLPSPGGIYALQTGYPSSEDERAIPNPLPTAQQTRA
ncbi:MAG: hypothetical protein LUF30_11710, partial [Lachnospiraceae bacterium]|nr:hypothetical protein [Lachnospiraceae bacterium]